MKTKFNKIVSFLMILAMLFSIFPTNVFGWTPITFDPVNSGSEVITDASSGWAVGWGGINEDNFHGMIFSLYFAEGDWASQEEFNKAQAAGEVNTWQQLGETIYMIKENKLNKTDNLYSGYSVYNRMGNKFNNVNGNWNVTRWKQDWTSVATGIQYYNFKGTFPTFFVDGGKDKYVKFFTGLTSNELAGEKGKENWQKADLTNVQVVTDKILRKASYKITQDQFKQGILNKGERCTVCRGAGLETCKGHYGVYKLYFEPMLRVGISGSWYVMSVRDFAAWQKAYPNQPLTVGDTTYNGIAVASTTPLLKIGNETFLVTDELQINMYGHTGGAFQKHYRFDTSQPFYKSAGVGVVTSIPNKNLQRPSLIKCYVEISSIDADGNVTFKKAAPTIIEEAPFYITAEGNYTDYPMFFDMEMNATESSVGLLNDIFTTDKDLQISDMTEWTNTELITNTGTVKLQPTADDVAVYFFFCKKYNGCCSTRYLAIKLHFGQN